jgi:hypothetical protein
MKFLSEHTSDSGDKNATVYHQQENIYVVVAKSDTGSHYSSTFKSLNAAEDFAEDWVLGK